MYKNHCWMRGLLLVVFVLYFLCGCALLQDAKVSDAGNTEHLETYSYSELKKMDEITIDGESIFFVLREDQALPYRWNYEIDGEEICVDRDYVVDEPRLNLPNLAVGSSPAFHVFVARCGSDARGTIRFVCRHLYRDDACDDRQYMIYGESGELTVK